jgi:RimJ/RimL family protein N-acetyltransferase
VPEFEIGYWCRSGQIGRGLTTEAVEALTALAFTRLRARRVQCRTDARNLAAGRVCEKAGFSLETTLRDDGRSVQGALRHTRLCARTA